MGKTRFPPPSDEEEKAITAGIAQDPDNPEWTDADFAKAKPFKEAFPNEYKAWKARGRPKVEAPKMHIGFRLAPDVVNGIRATGRGYNARVEKVLRDALARGEL